MSQFDLDNKGDKGSCSAKGDYGYFTSRDGYVIVGITGVNGCYLSGHVVESTSSDYFTNYHSDRWNRNTFQKVSLISDKVEIPSNYVRKKNTDIIRDGDMYYNKDKQVFVKCKNSLGHKVMESFKAHIVVIEPKLEEKKVEAPSKENILTDEQKIQTLSESMLAQAAQAINKSKYSSWETDFDNYYDFEK